MSKINPPKGMARGVKLTRQAFSQPLLDIEAQVEGQSLDRDNLQQPYGSFRVSVHVPNLDSRFFALATFRPDAIQWMIPFALIPPQDLWSDAGQVDIDTPTWILNEVMLSFDQRGEPAAIASADHAATASNIGKLAYDDLAGYDITITLLEKTPMEFGGAAPWTPEREVFSMNLPPEAFSARGFRFNPFVKAGLNKQLNPYRTYILCLSAPDLQDALATRSLALPALTMSLKCRAPLLNRDTGTAIQNMPAHLGQGTARAMTITQPSAGSLITASGAAGVHTNLAEVDNVLTSKVDGGYAYDGRVADPQDIQTDAGYEILLVPMWSNFGSLGVANAERADETPYSGNAPHTGWTGHEIVVPLDYPLVIHHVLALVNYMQPRGMGSALGDDVRQAVHPDSATFTTEVGVGIGTGIRGDHAAFHPVAMQSWEPAGKAAITYDRVKHSLNGVLSEDADEPWDWEIIGVPLVTRNGDTGQGFLSQGQPFYCGRSLSWSRARTNAGDNGGASVVPLTAGEEQFLCFRWNFRDTVGLLPNYIENFSAVGNNTFALAVAIEVTPTGAITATPATTTTIADDSTGKTAEVGEPAHGGFAATRSTWWSWTAPWTTTVTLDTEGSAVDTTLGVYTGTAVNALTLVAQDDDSGTGTNSALTFSATRGTTYKIAVDSKAAGAFNLNMTLLGGAVGNALNTVYAGAGGHWIQCVMKKMLCNPELDVRL